MAQVSTSWLDPRDYYRCTRPGCKRQRWGPYSTCYRHTPVSRETLYKVWRVVTADPRLSVREIAQMTGISTQTTQRALCHLTEIGVIAHQEGQVRARTIIEPFSWIQWP